MSNVPEWVSLAQRDRQKQSKRREDESEQLHRASYIIVCEGSASSTSSWDALIRALKSAEPCVRHLTMKCIRSCLRLDAGDVGVSQPMRRDMTQLIMDILSNDVEEKNRSLASLALGLITWAYGASTPSLGKDIFHACIRHLQDLQSQMSQLTMHRPGYNQARAQAIQALDTILQCRLDLPPPAFALIAHELTEILNEQNESREHDLVRAQVVFLLANLPGTSRNRQRSQPFWPILRPIISRAVKSIGNSNNNPDNILIIALSSKAFMRLIDSHQPSDTFVSQWYGRVPDAILDRFPLYDQLSGYSELQYSLLMNSEKEGSTSGRNQLREDTGPCDYLGIIDKEDVLTFIKRYSRRAQIIDILPEKFDLTFQAENIINTDLFFDAPNNRRILHLTNRSSKQSHRFAIQIAPTRHFTAYPAFGEIAPHSSIPITIRFERIAHLEKGVGYGYIRLRSWTGFAFERIPISFYNGQFLQVLNGYIDFGACPLGRCLQRRLYVKNIGISAMTCHLDLCMPDTAESPFEFLPRSATLTPGAVAAFEIRFRARTQSHVQVQMVVSSPEQQYPILVTGSGLYPITIAESVIDMGPCQPGQKVATPLNLTNLAPYPFMVQFDSALRGLVIPSSSIPAGQTRTIMATWDNDDHDGYVEDLVYVRVPECGQIAIRFRASVGCVLTTPLQSPLRLPFISVHMVLQGVIPVQNTSPYDAEFVIDGLEGTPFYIQAVDGARLDRDRRAFTSELANRPAPSMLREMLSESRDRHYTVKAHSTLYLIVLFSSHKPGFFERDFTLHVISPRAARWPPYQLRAAAILDNEKFPLKKLLMFFGEPGAFKTSELTRLPSKDFEGPIESRLVFGETWEGIAARSETFAFGSFDEWGWTGRPLAPITVENLSPRPHNFSMMLTYPFIGTSSRHGICGAFDKMAIPNEIVADHRRPSPIDGFVVIRDNFAKTSMCWMHLLETDLVEVAAHHHHDRKLVFTQVDVDTISQRPLTIRNRCGVRVPFRVRIETETEGEIPSSRFWCDESEDVLDRWEQRTIWIQFRARSPGHYSARLQLVYADPFVEDVAAQFVSFFAELIAECGRPAITADVDFVDFGHSGVGLKSFHSLTITNQMHHPAVVHLLVETPFAIGSGDTFISVAPMSSMTVQLSFNPVTSGRFSNRLQMVCGDSFQDVMLFGEGGVMSLTSSLGPPQSGPNITDDEHDINMGAVRVCTETGRALRLINNGTIEVEIARIVASADEGLVYQLMDADAADVQDLPKFGQEPLDAPIIDWDEVAYQKLCADIANASRRRPGHDEDAAVLPHRLSPGSSLSLQVTFSRYLTGIFKPTLRVETRQTSGQMDTFVFAMKFNVHDILEINEARLEFGVVPYLQTRHLPITFQNDCLQAVSWRLEIVDASAQRCQDHQKTPIRNDVFTAQPSSGVVQGSGQQQVLITFNSTSIHCICSGRAILHTSEIGSSSVEVTACSGAPLLSASETLIAFGCISLGSSKSKVVMLSNEGELPAVFIVKLTLPKRFHVVPMRGVIAARSRQPLWIKFTPSDSDPVGTQLRVDWGDQERISNRITIDLSGSGGSSQIVIKQSSVDFGLAMLGADTTKVLRVYNAGAAEALLRIDLPDPALSVPDTDGTFFVKPGSFRDLEIVFHPTTPAPISGQASIYSQEVGVGAADRIQVQIKGRVGVPNLQLGPADIIGPYTLNMGVCVVRRTTQRQFYVENAGNMDVPFEVRLYRSSGGADGGAARHDQIGIGTSGQGGAQTVQSWLPQLEPRDPSWAQLIDSDLVAAEPDHFHVEPRAGVLAQGQRVQFTVTFAPVQSDEYLDVAVSIWNPSAPMTLIATALSDEPSIDLDMAERVLDLGLCRCGNTFRRRFRILNRGSIPYQYHIGPDMRDPQWAPYRDDYEAARLAWTAQMKTIGFVFQYAGLCPRRGHDTVTVQFTAPAAGQYTARARIVCSGGYEQIEVRALGGTSLLQLYRPAEQGKKGANGDVIDFGLRPIGQVSQATIVLRNVGLLGTGFLISRTMPDQFDVYPLSGRIEPGIDLPIRITFRPSTFGLCQFDFKIKGVDNIVDSWRIVGRGGKGHLQVHYLHAQDQRLKGLDFGSVQLGQLVQKSLIIYNEGEVDLDLTAVFDQPAFAIRVQHAGQPYRTVAELDAWARQQGLHRAQTHPVRPSDLVVLAQARTLDVVLGPKQFLVATVLVAVDGALPGRLMGQLVLASQFNTMAIAVRAETGSVLLVHTGDLQFGSVGVEHVYEKQLTLINNGSLAASAQLYCQIGNVPNPHRNAVLVLVGTQVSTYGRLWRRTARLLIRIIRAAKSISGRTDLDALIDSGDRDPDTGTSSDTTRSANRKQQICEVVEPLMIQLQNVRLTHTDHYDNQHRVESSLTSTHPLFDTALSLANIGSETSRRLALLQNAIEKKVVQDQEAVRSPLTTLLQIIGPALSNIRGVSQISSASLLPSTAASTISAATKSAYVSVHPSRINLDVDVPVSIKVKASFPAQATFIGSLIVETDLLGCSPYSIRISASPMNARMICNDASPMKFGRISLGSAEVQTRVLTNTGELPIRFSIRHRNFGLIVNPSGGYLEAEDSVQLQCTFRPVDEQWQTSPVSIETDSTDSIEFEFSGAGGVPRLHLASFDRYDFGRCMAGRTSNKAIRIYNIGNAQLPVLRCLLDQTVIFKKGADWPSSRFNIDPDSFFDLQVEFTPQSEDVFRGRVVIETESRVVAIELIGTGREALLTYQTQNVDLTNTIVGNLYRRDIVLNNVSDLEYPLQVSMRSLALPDLVQDLTIETPELVLEPFEQRKIHFLYKPTRVVDTVVTIRLSSIYSENDVSVPVTTGTAEISLDTDLVDFGQFQKGFHCSRSVTIRNSGTISVAFRLHSSRDPDQLDFTVSRWRGLLVPDRDVEIIFKTKLAQLGAFEDELCLETQLDGKRHFIRVCGQCDTPIVDPAKFHRVDFGDCLVGETATQSFVIENSGGFPLTYKMKATFPIKVMPNQGSVAALSRQRFSIQWIPSGGYGLRSTLKVHTNLGVFDVNVKGRGAYPRFTISSAFLDFGIGALRQVYEQKFRIINRGKVAIRFSIPYTPSGIIGSQVDGGGSMTSSGGGLSCIGERHGDEVCPGFTVIPMRGALAAGESVTVRVKFEPRDYRKYSGNIVIESKGRYREVAVLGAGGTLRLDVPARLDLGSCPAGFYRHADLLIANTGDVLVNIRAASIDLPAEMRMSCQPASMTLPSMSRQTMTVYLKVDEGYSGAFEFSIILVSNESTWRIPVYGRAITLCNSFSHLTAILMSADINMRAAPISMQQWPNALDQDTPSTRYRPALPSDDDDDQRAAQSVMKLLLHAVCEMARASDTSINTTTFSDRLITHLEAGITPVEGEYVDRDVLAGLVARSEPEIRRPNISLITNLVEPVLDDDRITSVISSAPLFLPELTII